MKNRLINNITLNPNVSSILIISFSLGPMCLLGKSSLGGNKGPSCLEMAALKHLILQRVLYPRARFIALNISNNSRNPVKK